MEYSSPDAPQNGRLQILGSASGQFANVDYQPNITERDFYIFPYEYLLEMKPDRKNSRFSKQNSNLSKQNSRFSKQSTRSLTPHKK